MSIGSLVCMKKAWIPAFARMTTRASSPRKRGSTGAASAYFHGSVASPKKVRIDGRVISVRRQLAEACFARSVRLCGICARGREEVRLPAFDFWACSRLAS